MDIQSLLPYIGGAIVIILLLLIVTIGYVKAPPDTAYIISERQVSRFRFWSDWIS